MLLAFHKLATLRAKLDGEKVEPYKSVFSVEFERFGKVLPNVDGAKVCELLQKLPCPSDSVTYVPSEPVLETPELMADMQDRVYAVCQFRSVTAPVIAALSTL